MLIALSILLLFMLAVYIFLQQPRFGKAPSRETMQKIRQSPHYKNGQFQNISLTPALTEGASYSGIMKKFLFGKKIRPKPAGTMPSKKIDLLNLPPGENVLVWFGHSSCFFQVDGKRMLVDPVLSGSASPINFTTRSFAGSDVYSVEDLPTIDVLFISHDHYDHLDHDTIRRLNPNVKKVITGLGVGAHLQRWGYQSEKIIEKDWNEEVILGEGFSVVTATARHFSGRSFKRNGTLWTSYILKTPTKRIYIGADSGYDVHFKNVGDQYGPFDLAILENGQYDKDWKYIHMMPEEAVQASIDLRAAQLLPVHWGKFSLGNHEWDEPILRLVKEADKRNVPVIHPMIGEKVNLDAPPKAWPRWWEAVK